MNATQLAKIAMDPEEYRKRFAERAVLAKLTEEEAVAATRKEWAAVQRWVASDSTKPGSFLHACDTFDIEPDAARRAIRERKV